MLQKKIDCAILDVKNDGDTSLRKRKSRHHAQRLRQQSTAERFAETATLQSRFPSMNLQRFWTAPSNTAPLPSPARLKLSRATHFVGTAGLPH